MLYSQDRSRNLYWGGGNIGEGNDTETTKADMPSMPGLGGDSPLQATKEIWGSVKKSHDIAGIANDF